jgi:hypothetical protein
MTLTPRYPRFGVVVPGSTSSSTSLSGCFSTSEAAITLTAIVSDYKQVFGPRISTMCESACTWRASGAESG